MSVSVLALSCSGHMSIGLLLYMLPRAIYLVPFVVFLTVAMVMLHSSAANPTSVTVSPLN